MPSLPASPVPAPLLSLPAHLRAALPLQGLTVLAVEDSRFASDALRLMCQRAGARLRRAETLETARAHLRTYRPDVVIVDLGLPDGRGEALIRDLVLSARRPAVILGTSGAEGGRSAALAAGADGFLDKPFESLAAFCLALRRHLPDLDVLPPPESKTGSSRTRWPCRMIWPAQRPCWRRRVPPGAIWRGFWLVSRGRTMTLPLPQQPAPPPCPTAAPTGPSVI